MVIFFIFIMQGRSVFENSCVSEFTTFDVTWCILFSLNIYIIYKLVDVAFDVYLAGAIKTLPATLLSFFKLAVFRRGETPCAASFTR